MKIVYDNIVFSLQKTGGISVVWSELLKRLLIERKNDLQIIEYYNANQNIFRKTIQLEFKKKKTLSDYLLLITRYINPKMKNINYPFIFHSSYYRVSTNKNAINVTTVHDFIYEKFRRGIKKEIHCYQKKLSILNSDFIICVSENTKKDLLTYYPNIAPEKVFVVYNGVSEDYFITDKNYSHELPYPTHNYMIYLGVRDEYKRFDIAIKTAKQLNINLVIVGGGKLSKKELTYLNSQLSKSQYQAFTNLSNFQLNNLYSNALCLMYPSTYEGFGIPVIEAQRAGCPVVAYNNGAVKEIIGDTPLLFNRFDITEISDIITVNLFNSTLRNEIINCGIANSKRFSWDITYEKTKEIYDLIAQ